MPAIELEEVIIVEVSDEALAAAGGGCIVYSTGTQPMIWCP